MLTETRANWVKARLCSGGRSTDRRVSWLLFALSLSAAASLVIPTCVSAWPEYGVVSSPAVSSRLSISAKQETTTPDSDEARSFYVSEVDPGVQRDCVICHKTNGAAPES